MSGELGTQYAHNQVQLTHRDYLGVNADREAMRDLDVPPSLLRESLDELLEAAQ